MTDATALDLHNLLKTDATNPQPVNVSITQTAAGAVTLSARGRTITTPFLRTQDAKRALTVLLGHYPAPVSINGEPVARTPFISYPNLFSYHQVDGLTQVTQRLTAETINHARIHSGIIHAEGLTYVYGGPTMMTAAIPETPPPEDGFAFIKAQFYEMYPNIALTPQQAAAASYAGPTNGTTLFVCYPPPGAADEQIAEQIQDTNRLIRQTSPWATEPRWNSGLSRHGIMPERAGLEQIWTPNRNGAWVIPQPGQTAARPDATVPQAAAHSLTRALLQNPQTGIIPAEPRQGHPVTVEPVQATIVWADGETADFRGEDIEDGIEFPNQPDHLFQPGKSIAASITITARLKVPGQPDQDFPLPADTLILGHPWEDTTFITPDHPGHPDPAAIAERQIEALWDQDAEEHYLDPRKLTEQHITWWTRAFHGDDTGFQQELDTLAANFYHQSPEPDTSRTSLGTGPNGNSITWRPPDSWDWLDPIIRQYAPDADAAQLKRITEAAQRRLEQTAQETLHRAVQEAL